MATVRLYYGNENAAERFAHEAIHGLATLVPGEEAAGSVADTGCKMAQPT